MLVHGNDTISPTELKRLLHELKDSNSGILIRYRLLGQMWYPNFLRVFMVTDQGAVLIDHTTNKTELISNFADIVQFELDTRYQLFQPNFHYKIQP